MEDRLPRGTVTFLFSDIEGSTELSRRHGAAYGDLRAEHRRLVREALAAHRGQEIDTEGDAFFAVFERATDAIAAAVAAQRALAATEAVRVRMGLHTTDPHLHAEGYVGVGVSRAARICAAAHGGQVVLSPSTASIVEDDLPPDVQLRDLGDHYLKDISRPQRLFQAEADGLPLEFPPLGARPVAGTIATLLALDIAGWRRVLRELGDDGADSAAAAFQRIAAKSAAAHDGFVAEQIADWAVCVFSSPKQALLAAVEIRATLRNADWIHGTEKPELKAAVHSGRLTSLAGGRLGSSAHRVAKLCDSAEPGQILVSQAAQALLEGEILGELRLRDLGERELTGHGPTRIYELLGPYAPAT